MKTNRWKKNLRLYYAFRMLCTMNFVMPMFMLFLSDLGLSTFQIFVTQGTYTVTEMLLTVPSGVFADKVGRKKTLIISTLLYACGFLAYYASTGFIHILLAEIVFAVSSAAFHGTGEAFLYDTLAQAGKERSYKKVLGTAYAIQSFVVGFASVAGAWMADLALSLPFLVSALPISVSMLPLFFLDEPKRAKAQEKSYMSIMTGAASYAWKTPGIRTVIYFTVVTTVVGYAGFMLYQPLLTGMGMSIKMLGFVIMGMGVLNGLANKLAHRIDGAFGKWDVLFVSVVLRSGLYLLIYLATGPYLAVWAILIDMVSGVAAPLVQERVNSLARSHDRATVLSITSMAGTLSFSMMSPLVGMFVDAYTTQEAYLMFALLLGAYSLRHLLMMFLAKRASRSAA